jgi:hypothetical protein
MVVVVEFNGDGASGNRPCDRYVTIDVDQQIPVSDDEARKLAGRPSIDGDHAVPGALR